MLREYSIEDLPSLEEQIYAYKLAQESLAIQNVRHFESMFKALPPSTLAKPYQFTSITSGPDLKNIWAGKGFYLILGDYLPPWERSNPCTLSIEKLPVIYRGQADKVKERLRSHLDNRQYRAEKNARGQSPWERCLKLDEIQGNKGGINIEDAPFSSAKWAVLVLPMPKSTSNMRELVEWAFDRSFNRPVASNEPKKIPPAVQSALDKEQAKANSLRDAFQALPHLGAQARAIG